MAAESAHAANRPSIHPGPGIHGQAAGLGRYRLLGPDLERPTKGVRIRAVAGARSLRAHAAALQLVLPSSVAFSHLTALELMGLPVPRPWSPGDPIHVTSSHARKPVRRTGVICHLRTDVPATTHQGLRVVPASQAWLQSASMVDRDWLVVLADAMCRDAPDRLDQLRREVRRSAGQRGAVALREAAAAARTGSQSVRETQFRLLFARHGIPEPRLNIHIDDGCGGWLARPDFLWDDSSSGRRLVAEYDSEVHHLDARQWHRDVQRDRALRAAGWPLVVLTNADFHRPADALTLIGEHLGVRLRRTELLD